jgi:hypothetical protein
MEKRAAAGKRLVECRGRLGLSQAELVASLDPPQSVGSLRKWEEGLQPSKAVQLTLDDFFSRHLDGFRPGELLMLWGDSTRKERWQLRGLLTFRRGASLWKVLVALCVPLGVLGAFPLWEYFFGSKGDQAASDSILCAPAPYGFQVEFRRSDVEECYESSIENVPRGARVRIKLRYKNETDSVETKVMAAFGLPAGLEYVGSPFVLTRSGDASTKSIPVESLDSAPNMQAPWLDTGDYLPGEGFKLVGDLQLPEKNCGVTNMVLSAAAQPSGQPGREDTAEITLVRDCGP